jgi:hypothetical protein
MNERTGTEGSMPSPATAGRQQPPRPGYLYRVYPADADQLRGLISEIVCGDGSPGWIFGGASVWDFDATLDDKRKNLRPITPIDPKSPLDVRGDFGHAFSQRAEVRWKRITQAHYDVLILTEGTPIVSLSGYALSAVSPLTTRAPQPTAWMVLATPETVREQQRQWRLGYIEYLGANQAVRFVRYTIREERAA